MTKFFKEHVKKIYTFIIFLVVIYFAFFGYISFFKPDAINIGPFTWNLLAERTLKVDLKVELISGLDIGRSIKNIKNNVYGYAHPSTIVYAINNKDIDNFKFDAAKNIYSFHFKIIKLLGDEIYLFGYVTNESYLNLSNTEYAKNTPITILPKSYGEFNKSVMIPLGEITKIDSRNLEDENGKSLYVIDLVAKSYKLDTQGY